jgi:hypothetical protein
VDRGALALAARRSKGKPRVVTPLSTRELRVEDLFLFDAAPLALGKIMCGSIAVLQLLGIWRFKKRDLCHCLL